MRRLPLQAALATEPAFLRELVEGFIGLFIDDSETMSFGHG